jgi:hypothetical protein
MLLRDIAAAGQGALSEDGVRDWARLEGSGLRAPADTQMTVTYEVGGSLGGGQLDIDFYVSYHAGSSVCG